VYLLATGTMKESAVVESSNAIKEKINILKYKMFTALIIPNVFRGFCSGMVGMTVTIGYFTGLIDGSTANYVIIITNVMHIVSSFAFSKISQTIPDKYVLLGTSVVIAILLPLMTISNTTMFLVLYTVLYFFYNVLNNAVPVTVTKIVDYKIAGQYSSGRMLLNTLGVSLAGFVSIPMFRAIGVVPTLVIAGAMQVISGAGYFMVLRNRK
jgi:predicted MFS family arabinose efflux permease